jgi:hypothetical protein
MFLGRRVVNYNKALVGCLIEALSLAYAVGLQQGHSKAIVAQRHWRGEQ